MRYTTLKPIVPAWAYFVLKIAINNDVFGKKKGIPSSDKNPNAMMSE